MQAFNSAKISLGQFVIESIGDDTDSMNSLLENYSIYVDSSISRVDYGLPLPGYNFKEFQGAGILKVCIRRPISGRSKTFDGSLSVGETEFYTPSLLTYLLLQLRGWMKL